MSEDWRSIFPRMLVDAILLNVCFSLTLITRVLIALNFQNVQSPHDLIRSYVLSYTSLAPLLTLILLGVFLIHGIYTRTRFYVPRLKWWTIFQAVMLSYLIFVAVIYISLPGQNILLPRSTFLASFLATALCCGAVRLAKSVLLTLYSVKPRHSLARRKIEKVLVVGGAGYIGSMLVRELLAAGYQVRLLDLLLYGSSPLQSVLQHPSLEFRQGDFRNVETVATAVKDTDAVIHLAAIVGDPACALNHKTTVEINLAATLMLTEVCKGLGVQRFLFASTCSVYGATDHKVSEKTQPNPLSLYSSTKLDSERLILVSRSPNFHPTVLRLASVFGYSFRQRFDLVINLLTAQAVREGRITIFNQKQWRPFIHIKDVCRAFMLLVKAPPDIVSGEIFNVGSDEMNYSLNDAAQVISARLANLVVDRQDNADPRNYRVSFDKIRTRLSFTCNFSLEQGVDELLAALQSEEIGDYRDKRYSNYDIMQAAPPKPLAETADLPIQATISYLQRFASAE